MDIRTADADDVDQVQELTDLLEACRQVDAPFQPAQSAEMVAGRLRYGWDLEPDINYIAYDDGAAVARGSVYVSEIRSRIDAPLFTGVNGIKTTCVSASTRSLISIFSRTMSAPVSIRVFNSSPVSRILADGSDTVLPARTTFTY